jgi:hypothetical protein
MKESDYGDLVYEFGFIVNSISLGILLATVEENHQQYITQSRVIHKLCNIFLNTIQKHYKHSHFLYYHNYWEVCVNNTHRRGYVLRNFVLNPAGYK